MPFIVKQNATQAAEKLQRNSEVNKTAANDIRPARSKTILKNQTAADIKKIRENQLQKKMKQLEVIPEDVTEMLPNPSEQVGFKGQLQVEDISEMSHKIQDAKPYQPFQKTPPNVGPRESIEYRPLGKPIDKNKAATHPKVKPLLQTSLDTKSSQVQQIKSDMQRQVIKMEQRLYNSNSQRQSEQSTKGGQSLDSTYHQSQSEITYQQTTGQLANFQRIKIRSDDKKYIQEQKETKMLKDFTEEKLSQTITKMVNGQIDLDIRKLQVAIFSNSVNQYVNDYHKAQVGRDLSSAWPHYLWLGLWGVILGCGITLLIIFNQIKIILTVLSYMFYFFIALEYILMFSSLKTGNYPVKPQIPEDQKPIEKGKIGLVIPVGWGIKGLTDTQKTEKRQAKIDVLTNTLDASIKVFNPVDVFVFHNSSEQELPDEEMQKCCEGRAVYVPVAIGSKSISAYYGAILCNYLGYEYVIIMDDDTRLPIEMATILSQPLSCDAYCMAIAAGSNDDYKQLSNSAKLFIGLQDIEYKLSDLSKITQFNFTNTSSVLAPHGAINMWKTDLLSDIMNEHNCIFHGEDYQMGLIMRMRHKTKRLGIINNCIVTTVAPPTLKELYQQRLTSWDLAAQQFLWGGFCASQRSAHYMQVLLCLPCTIDNIYLRIITLEDIWTVIQDYLRVVLLAYHIIISIVYGIVNIPVMVMYLIVIGSQWIIAWALEYVKFGKRPDLQIHPDARLKTIIAFPIYRFCFSFVRVFSLLRFFFKFESIKRNALPIRQMNLPEPKKFLFAYPGLTKNSQSQQHFDPAMIAEVVKMTMKEQKAAVRDPTKIGQLPRVFTSLDRGAVQKQQRLIPKASQIVTKDTKQFYTSSEDIKRTKTSLQARVDYDKSEEGIPINAIIPEVSAEQIAD